MVVEYKKKRGVVHSFLRHKQEVYFIGLELPGGITPTDMDGFTEVQDTLFIYCELKFAGKKLDYGQELALRRNVNAVGGFDDEDKKGRYAYLAICSHETPVDKPIMAADSIVTEMFYRTPTSKGTQWRKYDDEKITFKQFIRQLYDNFLERGLILPYK